MKKVVTIVALTFTAACAGKSAGYSPIDGANSQAAGGSLADSAEGSAGSFGGPNGPSLVAGCETRSPAQPADSDADRVPDSVTITYANCMTSGSNGSATVNGTVVITDGTPSAADFNFNATHSLNLVLTGAGTHAGEDATINLSGTRAAAGAASGSSFTINDATANDATYTKASVTSHVSDSKTWNVTYTPDTAWTPGTAHVAGGLSVTGAWSVHVNEKSADATLTSTGLRVDPACPKKIVAGSIVATYAGSGGANATVTVSWAGCNNRTVTYTGP